MNTLTSKLLVPVFTAGGLIFLGVVPACKKSEAEPPVLSSVLPDYKIDYTQSQDDIQTQFDTDMWETFVAICFPADGLKPVAKGKITDQKDARAVFENYSFNYDLFLLNPTTDTDFKPVGWGDPQALDAQRRERWNQPGYAPELVGEAESREIENMALLLALDEFIQASNDEPPHVPLADLNGAYVRTGVLYNDTTYQWVIEKQVETYTGVKAAESLTKLETVKQVNKDGEVVPVEQKVYEFALPPGAIQLKTSWKILGEDDDPSRFHTAWAALLFENFNFTDDGPMKAQTSIARVGLVGMHIAVKTESQPDLIWATFEHVDNCPEADDIEDRHYSFYDYAKSDPGIVNKVPEANRNVESGYYQPEWFDPEGPSIGSGQIVREIPIPAGTQAVNRSFQEALAGTVWANYQLVGTQWTNPDDGKIIPALLSNTTLETFDQKEASCLGCHHQLRPNTFKETDNNDQYTMGNVLNLKLNLQNQEKDPEIAVYSDYMWSLLKWSNSGQLTWKQIKEKK